MNQLMLIDELQEMRKFYQSGATKPISFRLAQLKKLRRAIESYESLIAEALFIDLKRSREVAYATETGIALAELNEAIRNLPRWLEPKDASTNLVNLPSGSKVYRDPLGVVMVIAPWNYPFQLLMVPLVGAIAGGNAVVLKPSELAPATARIVEKIITETFSSNYVK
ncbi:MAG: aldehyde dehydrogenase family protein, partial [Flavitalea sp.]